MQELFVKDLLTEPGKARTPRMHAHDIRLGDRFVFRIQELKSPLGGIWLEPERKNRAALIDAVWAELQKHYATQQPVGGRILNPVQKGYAVGIAGVVGLLHFNTLHQDGIDMTLMRKLGTLQPFVVSKVEPKYNELMVRFATGFRQRSGGAFGGRPRASG
jgi:ribosomal protein S1